jgi:Zn-dependent protease
VACDQCHALVHGEELERLAAEAKALEAKGQPRQAREQWLMALRLLPSTSKQADWIERHARSLDNLADSMRISEQQPSENKWGKRLGPIGALGILLAKSKGLLLAIFKLKFLLSFAAFLGFYWAAFGMKFGIGFAVLILIHELGHFLDIKRRGLPADMPVFLPGFGAYVRWQALGVTTKTRAAISLAGPLAGFLAAAVCVILWWRTGNALWAGLARASASLNLLNLIPVWVLDGGKAVEALNKMERIWLLTACIAFWLLLGEGMFFLVALGAGYQVFVAKQVPLLPSRSTVAYFVSVLAGLGIVLRLVPGHGIITN